MEVKQRPNPNFNDDFSQFELKTGFPTRCYSDLLQDVHIYYNSLNDQENQIKIGWGIFFY